VDVHGAGAGIKHKSEESMLRFAGDPKSCKKTREGKPHADCSSPIQVFLEPVELASGASKPAGDDDDDDEPATKPSRSKKPKRTKKPTRTARRSRPRSYRSRRHDPNAEPPENKSVRVHFELPDKGGRWMLLGKDGTLLCELPCVRRVADRSGMKVQLDADRKEDIQVVKVPKELGYSPGRSVKAVPQSGRNSGIAAVAFYGGIIGSVVGLVMVLGKSSGCSAPEEDQSICLPGIGVLAGSGALAIGGGIWWYSYRREEKLIMTLIDDDLGSTKLQLSPTGLTGTF